MGLTVRCGFLQPSKLNAQHPLRPLSRDELDVPGVVGLLGSSGLARRDTGDLRVLSVQPLCKVLQRHWADYIIMTQDEKNLRTHVTVSGDRDRSEWWG